MISICIVTLNAKDLLKDCLESIKKTTRSPFEIIIVDNGSRDGTSELIQEDYSSVRLLANTRNLGYSLPMNQAIKVANGEHLLLLNPDTKLLPGTIDTLSAFLEDHPEVGICGPKVLNTDKTLQKPCRRGESRPWAVISYFSGLTKLFPDSPIFSEYLMSYRDEDSTHPVAGVSGSCMMVRREVIDSIGLLDEQFFAYQEDADFCRRARYAGWLVYYVPDSKIIHYGSQGGSHVDPVQSISAWHKSYYLYYKKNLAADYPGILNWFFYTLMLVKYVITLGVNAVSPGTLSRPRP
jgi:GT2 family glycosyltransferase